MKIYTEYAGMDVEGTIYTDEVHTDLGYDSGLAVDDVRVTAPDGEDIFDDLKDTVQDSIFEALLEEAKNG
jgi:hypothetical protein